MLRSKHLSENLLQDMIHSPELARVSGLRILAHDEFNYCRNGAGNPEAQALASDLDLPRQGVGLNEFYAVAERLPAAKPRQRAQTGTLAVLKASDLFSQAILPKGKPLTKDMSDGKLRLISQDDSGKPLYVWMRHKLPRAKLNLIDQSTLHFEMEHDLTQAQLVCEFYDGKGQKISHSMLGKSGSHALAIPAHCTQVRFGLRLVGTGQLSFSDITFGANTDMPPLIAGSSDVLVLAKQYPAYDDLYKYGFLHSRVRGYRQQGLDADVFRINPGIAKPYDEFEGIDVATGDAELLDATLRSGRYKHVLVHLLDRQMWEVLKKHLDKVKVTIWIHGAEIQHWKRREYEFTRMSAEEIEAKKRRCASYLSLWRHVFGEDSANLHFVFVSQTLKSDAGEDVGCLPQDDRCSVIHNHIDGNLFSHTPKPVEHRLKILSVRPYSSATYANDLTAAAIQELSKRPLFKELSFSLFGDGPLFDEVTAPLKAFSNVALNKGFLTQAEIAAQHKTHGVFLAPTRMDSQGVSRDEAMASGLVPVTSDVAAVPEFVDASCGFLAPPEDAAALADAIERLYHDPDLFQRLSQAAAERVRAQSGFEQTISREIKLITPPAAY
jgi:glycosyltransferase involved in cell wall biosynthesis